MIRHQDQSFQHLFPWFVARTIKILLIANAVGFVIYMALRVTIGAEWSVVLWLNNITACWGFVGFAACGIALLFRRRRLLIALQLPLIGAFMTWYGPQFEPHRGAAVPNGATLRVATFNVGTNISDPVQVAHVIEAMDADIVGLQDVSAESDLIPMLRDIYPYTVLPFGTQQIGLVSRYPIVEQNPYQKRFLHAVVNFNGRAVTVIVFTVLAPNHIWNPWTYKPQSDPPELAEVIDGISDETNPVIVLCDCNASDQSPVYRVLDSQLDDAFRDAGWGLGLTYPAHFTPQVPLRFPLMRLDYIWHGLGVEVYETSVWPDSGTSDHKPVVATLGVP
jgi:vancomycin resistance protein VanJ